MDKQLLRDQLDFIAERIIELEETIKTTDPANKGYADLVEGHNAWVDKYNETFSKLEHEDDNIERDTLDLEREKLEFEKEKLEYEKCHNVVIDTKDGVLRVLETGAKIAVTVLMIGGTIFVAKLAYEHDENLDLCNGRIWSLKDMFKLIKL